MDLYTSSPTASGWYWWKATKESELIELHVSQKDVDEKKYARFGGEWHKFPTFGEIADHREKSQQVDMLIEMTNRRANEYASLMVKFVEFLLFISSKTLVPKKDIRAFLEEVRKSSLK